MAKKNIAKPKAISFFAGFYPFERNRENAEPHATSGLRQRLVLF
jgi:hypothetical protein